MERWIKDYEGLYSIDCVGRVYSHNYRQQGIKRELKAGTHKKGYKIVVLCANGKEYAVKVHRLVAEAFMSNPENKPEINHIDGNPSNNNLYNLEWCTGKENIQHSWGMGRTKHINNTKAIVEAKSIAVLQIDKNTNEVIKEYSSIAEAGRLCGVHHTVIAKVCKGIPKHKTAGGYKWKYKEA